MRATQIGLFTLLLIAGNTFADTLADSHSIYQEVVAGTKDATMEANDTGQEKITQMSGELLDEADVDTVNSITQVVVTGTKNATSVRYLPTTVTVVDRDALTANQRMNILPTLNELVPGLLSTGRGILGYGVSGGGTGSMMMRGISSASGQVMVLIDGQPQYNGIYGHSIADAYHTLMADKVEVLRGPASLLYGSNAMGGVVNIITRKPVSDGSTTQVNVGAGSYKTFQSEVSNQFKKGRFSSTVAGQYARSDNHRPRMDFEQYGGFAKLNYQLDKHWNLYGNADVTHFNASWPGTTSVPMAEADQWITRVSSSLGAENHYLRTSGRISVYSNYGRHKINDGYNINGGTPQADYFRSKDALAGILAYQSANLWKGNTTTLGIDYQHIFGKAWYTDRVNGETKPKPNNLTGKNNNDEIAAYLDFRQIITEWFSLDAGIRYDHHSEAGGEWIPQGGLVFTPIQDGTLKASVSKGFRNPTMRELYLYPPHNPDLSPERLRNYELSWQHAISEGKVNYSLNVFHLDADNVIQTTFSGGKPKNVNTGKLHNTGAEMSLDWNVNRHWKLTTNHSYLYMKNKVVSAPTYKGYLAAYTQYGKWSGQVGLQQVCGLYTSVKNGAMGQNKKEDFTLLGATLNYQLLDMLKLWVRGDNLLAQKYQYVEGYPMPRATVMAGFNLTF